MNELRKMQEQILQMNRMAGVAVGSEDVVDDEGFSQPAPAPPREESEEVATVAASPKAALESYQLTKYPPKVVAIDLDARQVVASNGRFAMEEGEVRQAIAIAVNAMKRSFETILQTLVDQNGLNDAQPAEETGDVNNRPEKESGSVSNTRRGKERSRS